MKSVISSILWILIVLMIAEGICYVLSALVTPYSPGTQVTVLLHEIKIGEDGKPCRYNRLGFINQFGPNGENDWHIPERVIFPLGNKVSIIYPDSTTEWVHVSNILGQDEKPTFTLCPTIK